MSSPKQSSVITLRMSPDLHHAVRRLAFRNEVSMNTLLLSIVQCAVRQAQRDKDTMFIGADPEVTYSTEAI